MPQLRSRKKLENDSAKKEIEDEALDSTNNANEKESEISQKETDLAMKNPSSESEDEAPESISLSTSKDVAISKRHEEKAAIDDLKKKEKQRRRNKDETLRKQKEMRVNREKSRISDEILLKVAEKQEQVAKRQEIEKPNIHTTFDNDDDDGGGGDDIDEGEDQEAQEGLQLIVLNQTKKRKSGVLDSANAFLDNHFYGDRLKRVDTLSDENRKRKKRHYGPAIKFSKT